MTVKLYMDFWLQGGSVPLCPMLIKGQLYCLIQYLKNEQLEFKIKKAAIPFKVALASPTQKKKKKNTASINFRTLIKSSKTWINMCFHSNPKGNPKECSYYHTITLISHASKVMLKILQARLQQYMNWELPYVQAGFRKGRGTRDQIANIRWIIEKAREF